MMEDIKPVLNTQRRHVWIYSKQMRTETCA